MKNKDGFEIEYINPKSKEFWEKFRDKDALGFIELLTIEEIKEKYGVQLSSAQLKKLKYYINAKKK